MEVLIPVVLGACFLVGILGLAAWMEPRTQRFIHEGYTVTAVTEGRRTTLTTRTRFSPGRNQRLSRYSWRAGGALSRQIFTGTSLEAEAAHMIQTARQLDEGAERPWRELAEARGWTLTDAGLAGRHRGIELRVRRVRAGAEIKLVFESSLPEGMFVARKERLPGSPHDFDNPVLDMLLGVQNPPSDHRFDALAEPLLELVHGRDAELTDISLSLVASEPVDQLGPLIDQALALVEALLPTP